MALLKAPLIALAGFLLLAVVTLSPKQRSTDQLGQIAAAVSSPLPSATVALPPTLQANKLPAVPSAPTPSQLLSAVEAYFKQGLPFSLLSQLKGPKGDKGDSGLPGQAGIQGPSGYSIGSVYPTTTSTNAGTIGGVSYFGSKDLSTQTLTVSGATTLSSLTATGGASIGGSLTAGTSTLGATTLASLTVNGATSWSVASISSNLDVSGTVSANDIITKGPYADVRAYGAKGDGATDDTSAIQAAINSQTTGGEVYFPVGTYKITSTLNLRKSTRLIGQGMGVPRVGSADVTVIDASAITATAAISGPGNASGGAIENMRITGPAYGSVASSDIGGSVGVYSGYFAINFTMRNVYVSGFANSVVLEYNDMAALYNVRTGFARTHGLVITNSSNVQCFGCLFTNNGMEGGGSTANIYIRDTSTRINFYDALVDENGNSGGASIYVLSGTDISFENMLVYNTSPGYGLCLGNGTTNPSRVRLQNVRIQPFSGGQIPTNTIFISGGSGHVLEDVTTDPNGGGDIVDNGTGTTFANVNGKWNIGLSGNVGIGTTTPTTKLDVVGAASISTNFEVRTGYASLSNTLWVSPPGYAGNVGIGTTTPVQKLDVSGSVN
ncbi:MAG: glycosyl hydrolase family 28-related protein, partial [Patescibacteria group bacterium]